MNIWDTQLGTDFIRTMLDFFQKKAEVKQYTVTVNRLSMKDLQETIDAELAKGARFVDRISDVFGEEMVLIFEK